MVITLVSILSVINCIKLMLQLDWSRRLMAFKYQVNPHASLKVVDAGVLLHLARPGP